MYWFKNAITYRLTSKIDFSNIEEALQKCKFIECESQQATKLGWSAPLCTSEQLHYQANGHILLVSHKEEKILPSHVIKREMDNRIKELEEKAQRKLKKTEKLAIKDDVMAMLLPRAFSKHQFTALWIDIKNQLIYVDSSSAKRAEDTLALLRESLGSLPVVPISFTLQPSEVMTGWLRDNNAPEWLTLLDDGKLKSFETDSQATFKHQDLESDEIIQHVQAGKLVTSLALEWENHLKFTLNEDGTLSRLKFSDEIREKNDDISKEDIAQRFDADFFLMTAELGELLEKLSAEFGNIRQHS